MNLKHTLLIAVIILGSCAPYKQLKPEPEISPLEQGYIELKRGKKDFELKQDKKYFIEFPPPAEDNFYLVLQTEQKSRIQAYLTPSLAQKKTPGEKIADESEESAPWLVFPINARDSSYFFIIEQVAADIAFPLEYRYVPQWRFRFENKHAEYDQILAENRVDRTNYQTLGESFHFDGFNFAAAIDTIQGDHKNIQEVHRQLLSIESIFPADIVNSTDEAYQNYLALKEEIEEEIAFQQRYLAVLDFFQRLNQSHNSPAAFMSHVKPFIGYFGTEGLAENVLAESRTVLERRLAELTPWYEKLLREQRAADPLDSARFHLEAFWRIPDLYQSAAIAQPADFSSLYAFMAAFDSSARALRGAAQSLKALEHDVSAGPQTPPNDFFSGVVRKATAIKDSLPAPLSDRHGQYLSFACAAALNQEIQRMRELVEQRVSAYTEAAYLVPQLNTLKQREDYRGMLGLLTQYRHLDFLLPKYAALDRRSIEQQRSEISDALAGGQWARAEQALRALHNDQQFIDPAKAAPHKELAVRELEDALYSAIDRASRRRVTAFLEENVSTLEHVDSLYTDSVFLPVYDVTFSSGGSGELRQRKQELIAHLERLKKTEFPARAVTMLFEQFTKKPNDNGVLKARAIVAHGEHYEGNDKKIKRRVAEVNPWAAKWIVKAKQYRRVYALPVTTRRGENRYFVRFNIRVPTEAKFPVFDVNIKLPQDLAKNAASRQWYEKIEMNKSPLKNEGRFSITAPTAENGYVCRITPVQMKKDDNNYLDIYFNHPSLAVHSLSVMVQKPIMKKN
jgi:hypothetical protein